MDYSLTEGEDGHPVAHRPDCPVVQVHRSRNKPIITLFECDIPDWVPRCACLKVKDGPP